MPRKRRLIPVCLVLALLVATVPAPAAATSGDSVSDCGSLLGAPLNDEASVTGVAECEIDNLIISAVQTQKSTWEERAEEYREEGESYHESSVPGSDRIGDKYIEAANTIERRLSNTHASDYTEMNPL